MSVASTSESRYQRCGALTKAGRPCQREAVLGGRCSVHGFARQMSPEGKARQREAVSVAMRERWATWRKEGGKPLSPQGRQRIAAAQRLRWAARRSKGLQAAGAASEEVAAAWERGSIILTGRPDYAALGMDEDDFKAYEARILAGGELHRVDFARLSASQYGRLRNTLFLQRLARSAAIFEGGAYRGRLGARDALEACILQLRSAFPDAAPYLGALEAVSAAMAEANAGELPELFRPGVSATDRCSHLTVVQS